MQRSILNMFSGIIKNVARAADIQNGKKSMEVLFPVPKGWNIEEGESINIDGICSTVAKITKGKFQVFYMPETLNKTSLSQLKEDHVFNLERCLSMNELISGHLVYGHIDTTAKVSNIKTDNESVVLTFALSPEFTKYIVYKGSVAVNGVSLTIVSVDENSFSVSLIPYTLSHTNLGELKKGSVVNIEVDMLAKHIEKLLQPTSNI